MALRERSASVAAPSPKSFQFGEDVGGDFGAEVEREVGEAHGQARSSNQSTQVT
ncbi:hypothetical protein ACGF1Z_35545 [Streptomyces sp. NPDC048018]|uniref:hypothetical protein n=1 Tax=Streptomyces sp. NPDC048018 TaxID=3365499 RepID=UPI003717B2F9